MPVNPLKGQRSLPQYKTKIQLRIDGYFDGNEVPENEHLGSRIRRQNTGASRYASQN